MLNKKFIFYANQNIKDILNDLNTSLQGLSYEEAKQRLILYGTNEIKKVETKWFNVLKNQFTNPFTFVFIIISAIYFFTQQYNEAIILIVIMLINVNIGFYQEYQSSRAMTLLKSYIQSMAIVCRENKDETIKINELVTGDIIKLSTGDIIPADCRFIVTENCMVDESTLTGESVPKRKTHIINSPVTTLYDAYSIGYAGTSIIDGKAIAVIFATAEKTQFGSIESLATHNVTKSNLSKNALQLAKIIFVLVLISLTLAIGINLFFKRNQFSFFNFLLFSGALAITAIPSALPIVITFCLTRGAMALHKHKMIVKRLSAIEDLGNIEIFCTDKTGTLTENKLHVKNIYSTDASKTLLYAAYSLHINSSPKNSLSGGFDQAIINLLTPQQINNLQKRTIVKELPFTYERHRNIVLTQENNTYTLVTKGSTEYIVPQCPALTEQDCKAIYEWVKSNELMGDRVIAIAIKTKIDAHIIHDDLSDHNEQYDFLGLISFTDPLKPTAITAIKKAQELNVSVKILSGDSPYVCFTIAQQLGLENDITCIVLGKDFQAATEQQKMYLAHNRTIFARVTPEQKYQIIKCLQYSHTVGYIGDGINDAPALKAAHVGIAVNDAAEIARETAEIILLQKSLLHIILGIEEGRKVVVNTLKYIKVTISSNIGNFYSLALSSLFINYLPMLPLQLLFLDLITDLPLIALSTDSVEKKELKKIAHYSTKDIGLTTLLFGLISSPFDLIIFTLFKYDPATLQTSWFITSALTQLVLVFSLRTRIYFWKTNRPSFFLYSLCTIAAITIIIVPFTKFGQKLLLFARPDINNMLIIITIVIAYFIMTEIVKLFYYQIIHKEK